MERKVAPDEERHGDSQARFAARQENGFVTMCHGFLLLTANIAAIRH